VLVAHDSDVEHCKRREQNDLQDGVERHQNRNFYQWPDGCRQSFLASGSVHSDDNRNGQLEIVTGSSKTLSAADTITKLKSPTQPYYKAENNNEVDDEWCANSKHRCNLFDDVCAL